MSGLPPSAPTALSPSVFTRLTRLANQHSAINLAQGFPDFDPPQALIEAAGQAVRQHYNQYAPSPGLPALRQAVAAHSAQRYGVEYDPDTEVTVTVGATEGIWAAVTALVSKGDEVIVIEPYYETYPACVVAAGGVVRYVPTSFPDFRLDPDRLAAAFSPRTRLVLLNTPGNPGGALLTAEQFTAIAELAERHDAYLLCDETYEHLVYDGATHVRASAAPGCRDRTLVVSSASKTFSVTGWRVGWVLAPPHLTDAVRGTHQFITFAAPTPLQQAVATMLSAGSASGYFDSLLAGYTARREVLLDYLDRIGLPVARPAGAFFVMARCPDDDERWVTELIRGAGVAAIPGSAFYHDRSAGRDLVRFAFCKQLPTLHAAGARLMGKEDDDATD
ncbi:aminotransferase class I/II-fold pyridoxal phosphate-dependent enzyme [Actinoplanes sp. NPDC049596]|uniref:pyridoxal phosphate-dependent aminotransferase n=1 Tax=unclassified Actinoplanes TaxID=2626549 RepID=UPI003429EDEB